MIWALIDGIPGRGGCSLHEAGKMSFSLCKIGVDCDMRINRSRMRSNRPTTVFCSTRLVIITLSESNLRDKRDLVHSKATQWKSLEKEKN